MKLEIKEKINDGVFKISTPQGPAPLIIDSPHSGREMPQDFDPICDQRYLKAAEDRYVDRLFVDVPQIGATLIEALFPRSYIDVNRAEDDIDPLLLDEGWPHPLPAKGRSKHGIGLIRRLIHKNLPLYDRFLSETEIHHRIKQYYRPYHNILEQTLSQLHAKHGQVWHINAHSMPSSSAPILRGGMLFGPGIERADFVIGDRDGTSCSAEFTSVLKTILEDSGYNVALNNPYKGVEIVKRYGRPYEGFHSVQLEINKALYLNEDTHEPNENFERLKSDLSKMTAMLSQWITQKTMPIAAD